MTSLSIVTYYLVALEKRRQCCNFAEHVSIFCRKTLSIFAAHFSVFLQNNFQYFCRTTFDFFCITSFNIFAEHLSVFLQTRYQYCCINAFNNFPDNFSVVWQKISQHVLTPFSIFAEHVSVVLQNTSQYFLEIISQYFQKQSPEVFRPEACIFIKKETQAQAFSCEFCEIFKNTFFTEHLRTTASIFLHNTSYYL